MRPRDYLFHFICRRRFSIVRPFFFRGANPSVRLETGAVVATVTDGSGGGVVVVVVVRAGPGSSRRTWMSRGFDKRLHSLIRFIVTAATAAERFSLLSYRYRPATSNVFRGNEVFMQDGGRRGGRMDSWIPTRRSSSLQFSLPFLLPPQIASYFPPHHLILLRTNLKEITSHF